MCFCIYSVEDVPPVPPLSDDGADEGASDSWYIDSEAEEMQLDGIQELFNEDHPETENQTSCSSGHGAEVEGTSGSADESPNPTSSSADPRPRNCGVRTAPTNQKKKSCKNKRKRYRPYGNTTLSESFCESPYGLHLSFNIFHV